MRIQNGCVNVPFIKSQYDAYRNNNNTTSTGSSSSRGIIISDTADNNAQKSNNNNENNGVNNKLFLGIFHVGSLLGEGTYGKVRFAKNMRDDRPVALKIIDKKKLKRKSQLERVLKEIRIMSLIDNPHLCKLYECFETDEAFILELEYIKGMELFKFVSDKKWLSELEALPIFYQLLDGISYLHQHKIIHRDIKLENIIIDKKGNIKIIDFGFACSFEYFKFCDTHCGSPYYAAPEMVSENEYVGPEVDIWSLGVVLYTLVHGYLPFEADCCKNLYKKIIECKYSVDARTSPSLRNLINSMIYFDSRSRIRLGEIFKHPWVMYEISPIYRMPVSNINFEIVKKLIEFDFNENKLIPNLNNVYSTEWSFYKLIYEKSQKGFCVQSIGNINNYKTKNVSFSQKNSNKSDISSTSESFGYKSRKLKLHPNELQKHKKISNVSRKPNNDFYSFTNGFFSKFANLIQTKISPIAVIERPVKNVHISPVTIFTQAFAKKEYSFCHWNNYMIVETNSCKTLLIFIQMKRSQYEECILKISLIAGNIEKFMNEINDILVNL